MLAYQLCGDFFKGFGSVLLRNPIFLSFFQGWGWGAWGSGPPVLPSGSAHDHSYLTTAEENTAAYYSSAFQPRFHFERKENTMNPDQTAGFILFAI